MFDYVDWCGGVEVLYEIFVVDEGVVVFVVGGRELVYVFVLFGFVWFVILWV